MITHTTTQNRHRQSEQCGQDKLFSPALITSWLINFSICLVFYLSITVMVLYVVQRFLAPGATGGFVVSPFVAGAATARLFSGYLVDTFGGRRTMPGSLAVIMAACAAYMWAVSLLILIAIRIIHGLTYALVSTAVMAATQTAIPASRHAEGADYISLGTTLAIAIGSTFGLTPVGSVGHSVLFATAFGLFTVGLVLTLFLPQHNDPAIATTKDETTGDSSASETKCTFSFDDVMMPRVVPIGLFMLPIDLAYAGVITFLNRYSQLGGLTRGASFFFIAYAVAIAATCFSLEHLQDHHGDNPVITIDLVCFTISLLVLASVTTDWHVIAAGMFCGLGYSTLMPACRTISVHPAPTYRSGTGISTLLSLIDAGVGLSPIVFGLVTATMGFDKMHAGLTVVVVLAAVFYWFVHGREPVARRHRVNLWSQSMCGHFSQVSIR